MRIADQLDFDMARFLDEFFGEHAIVAERGFGFRLGDVEGRVHDAGGDVRGVTGLQDALLLLDPLFDLAGEHVDHLFEFRVGVEGVAFARR